jgi:hypothetical protein
MPLLKIQVLRNKTQCRVVNSYRRFGKALCLHLTDCYNLKVDATSSSEMSATLRVDNASNRVNLNLHQHHC